MNSTYESLLFYEDLPPERREALAEALAADPALAEAFAQWQRLRADVRRSLDDALPDRHLLVLYALEAKRGSGALTPTEREALQAARPSVEQALARHPALADVARQTQADVDTFNDVWEEHAGAPAKQPMERHAVGRVDRPAVPARRSMALRWAGRVAVAIAVVAFAAVLFLVAQRDGGMVTVETAASEVRRIDLADGSTVRLMGGSTLTYPDPQKETAFNRRARLVGRAFFDVARSEERFTLETPTAVTTVLGTSFGVEASSAATEVVLATGAVALAPDGAPDRVVMLEPGQMSRVAENALPSTPMPVDLTEALDWTGLLIFRTTPVEKIAALLSERYGVAVTVAPALEEDLVNGTFEQSQPLPEVLEVIAATLGAEVRTNPAGGYLLVPLP